MATTRGTKRFNTSADAIRALIVPIALFIAAITLFVDGNGALAVLLGIAFLLWSSYRIVVISLIWRHNFQNAE